jgi:hypothetical protein
MYNQKLTYFATWLRDNIQNTLKGITGLVLHMPSAWDFQGHLTCARNICLTFTFTYLRTPKTRKGFRFQKILNDYT